MDGLITSYFKRSDSKAISALSRSQKRPSSAFAEGIELDMPTNATVTKRTKGSSEPTKKKKKAQQTPPSQNLTQTPGESSSKLKSEATREVIVISLDDPHDDVEPNEDNIRVNTYPLPKRPPPRATRISSKPRMPKTHPRDESIVPATPDHDRPPSSYYGSISPIPFRGLTQTYSDETVGSSQSQEEDDYQDLASTNPLLPPSFSTPRITRPIMGGDDEDERAAAALISPTTIGSSQSQYLSITQTSPFLARRNETLVMDLEFVPSSQSQEKELEILIQTPASAGWKVTSRRSSTPNTTQPLNRDSSFSKELPVRKLTLAEEDEAEQPPHGDNNITPQACLQRSSAFSSSFDRGQPFHSSPIRSHDQDTSDEGPSLSQTSIASLTQDDSQPLFVLPMEYTPAAEPRSLSQASIVSLTQDDSQPLFSIPPENNVFPEPSLLQSSAIASGQQDSPPMFSLPPEVRAFQNMFEGSDESYPADFPMSLRI